MIDIKTFNKIVIAAVLCLLSAAAAASGSTNGKARFKTICTLCHDQQELLELKKVQAEWITVILGHPTLTTDAEAAAIAGYLEKTAGKPPFVRPPIKPTVTESGDEI